MSLREQRALYLVLTTVNVVMMWVEAYQQVPALLFDMTSILAVACLCVLVWLCKQG